MRAILHQGEITLEGLDPAASLASLSSSLRSAKSIRESRQGRGRGSRGFARGPRRVEQRVSGNCLHGNCGRCFNRGCTHECHAGGTR